jgi:formylglycine-generating enzyme required for sulfatase activity
MTFVLIPLGSFTMGSPLREKERGNNEIQHQVAISNSFYMQTTEVTQAQWYAVMGDNPSHFKGADLPVDRVSYKDIEGFIQKLNKIDKAAKYRLPTEAEWEYACRAGSKTAFCFGDEASRLGEYAWYKGNAGDQTHPVGKKKRNAWGLYDMHGNVWEWCQDWFGDYPSASVTDPGGPPSGSACVMRGGSWFYRAEYCRSAERGSNPPNLRNNRIGFRLVLYSQVIRSGK